MLQAFCAIFVGGIAFVGNARVLCLLSLTGIYYMTCAVVGFILGVMVNFVLSTKFVFSQKNSATKSKDITVYFVISLIGLGFTLVLMLFFT